MLTLHAARALALRLSAVAALAWALLPGCSGDSGKPPASCPPPQPAFALVIRAAMGLPLTRSTALRVSSGSGVETFDVESPPTSPMVVFCDVAPPGIDAGVPDAGGADTTDGGADVGTLACSLWTDGAADVTVTSEGYVTDVRSLQAKTNGCGVVTTTVLVELTPSTPDAGM